MVQLGTIPFDAGNSLVLGANLGSSLLPIWLDRKFEPLAQRVVYANFAVRGSLAIVALVAIHNVGPLPSAIHEKTGLGLIVVHLQFNASLLLLPPLLEFLERPFASLLHKRNYKAGLAGRSDEIGCLAPNFMDHPSLALASVRRETSGCRSLSLLWVIRLWNYIGKAVPNA